MKSLAGIATPQFSAREAGFWGASAVFTFALFFALAHVEDIGGAGSMTDIEDMPVVTIPLEPPPPKVAEPAQPAPALMPIVGIEAESSDSPVSINVVPQDLTVLIPNAQTPPKATISLGVPTEMRPDADVNGDVHRVYQEFDVDQRPLAVVRVAPDVPNEMFGGASVLHVRLLVLIDTDGRAVSVHVSKSSGNPAFDDLVSQTVREKWLFSPAIRRGKKVRCLALQALRFNSSSGGPFSVK
jgi:TonB family protein